ncbi:MAG: hypothetical protein ACPGRX_03800, partial [Bdellovibrionales bacterium]
DQLKSKFAQAEDQQGRVDDTQIAALRDEVAALSKDKAALDAALDAAKAQISTLDVEKQDLTARLLAAEARNVEAAAGDEAVASLQSDLSALRDENAGLSEKLLSLEGKIAANEQVSHAEQAAALSLLRSENERLQASLDDARQAEKVSGDQSSEILALQSENSALRQKLDAALMQVSRVQAQKPVAAPPVTSPVASIDQVERDDMPEAAARVARLEAFEDTYENAASSRPQQAAAVVAPDNGLSEAQRQEALMKQGLSSGVAAADRVEAQVAAVAPMKQPQGDDVVFSDESMRERVRAAREEAARIEMAAANNVDAVSEREVSPEPVVQARVSEAVDAVVEPAAERDFVPAAAPVAAKPPVLNSHVIQSVLQASRIDNLGAVSPVAAVSGPGFTAFQWRAGQTFGSGEEKKLPDMLAFDAMVQSYLEKTQARCSGDFAIIPDHSEDRGTMRVDSYEVACVGAGVNSAASIVFFNKGDMFAAVAHEVPADHMDAAMDIRDRVFATLTGGSRS